MNLYLRNYQEKPKQKIVYLTVGVPRYFKFDKKIDLILQSNNSSARKTIKGVSGVFTCILNNLKGQEEFHFFTN